MIVAGQTICLNMIVKNEASVIRRCLDSVLPIINRWVIVDTGSTDGTQNIIRAHLKNFPGELHERPWRDFAFNRSEALALARRQADYTFIIDADDALEIASGFQMPTLSAGSYTVEIADTATRYWRPQLVNNALPWRYEGVLHEFLTCAGSPDHGGLSGIRIRRNHDGARRNDPETYRRDAALLDSALRTETSPFLASRYRFYLAQSYRDCDEKAKALENYLARAELGFWDEEVFVSLYQAAQIKEQLGYPDQEVVDAYLRAAAVTPTRSEALHRASRFCRDKGRNEEGYQIAKRGLDIPIPSDSLFVEPWVYETGLLDEFAVNAYWSGHNRDCLDASLKLLATGKLSASDTQRVIANARFASERLPNDLNLGSLGAEGFIEQHALARSRPLRSSQIGLPRVLVAIFAEQEEVSLPLYLECIEALDYPKSSIVLYIRTNGTDNNERIIREWLDRVRRLYGGVEFDAKNVEDRVEQFGGHDRNATRSRVLARNRNIGLSRTREHKCHFYFVSDVNNFIRACTLRELITLDLPIVAPLLRSISPARYYSNYHAEIDDNGYYKECDQYHWILNRWVRGVLEVPLVRSTYLVRADVINGLTYEDKTSRYEYVVFSDSARKAGAIQYLDNRQIYGYITADEGHSGYIEVESSDRSSTTAGLERAVA